MISVEMATWLTENFGAANYGLRLQDYTDRQISTFIKAGQIKSKASLFTELIRNAEMGTEKFAHLLGFKSAEDRSRLLAKIEDLQKKCHEP